MPAIICRRSVTGAWDRASPSFFSTSPGDGAGAAALPAGRPAGDGPLEDVLANRDLLLAVNLIHEHAHHHGALLHSHPHAHPPGKERHAEDRPEHHHEHGRS